MQRASWGPSRLVLRLLTIMSILSIILSAASLPVVCAAPWRVMHARQSNGNNPNSGFSLSVWVCASPLYQWTLDADKYVLFDMGQIPIIVILVSFCLCGLFIFRRRMAGLAERQTAAGGNAVSADTNATTAGEVRELTAADLAGDARTTTAATRRPRRSRRPRRTPSQVSTKSLPAYMAEPGDHEVVIYRYVFRRSHPLGTSHSIIDEQRLRRYGRKRRKRTARCKQFYDNDPRHDPER